MMCSTYSPCDLNGCWTQYNRSMQSNNNFTKFLLHVSVVNTLGWRAYIYQK